MAQPNFSFGWDGRKIREQMRAVGSGYHVSDALVHCRPCLAYREKLLHRAVLSRPSIVNDPGSRRALLPDGADNSTDALSRHIFTALSRALGEALSARIRLY